jgi:uncharacterized metal-binding protein YceD (DUF177 family)
MSFKGVLNLKVLDRKPFETQADQSEAWVMDALKGAAPPESLSGISPEVWAEKAQLKTEMRAEKLSPEYEVQGKFEGTVQGTCSRCGDPFMVERQADFRVFLRQADEGTADEENAGGDPDYVYFEDEEIDLSSILREQIIVAEPMAECPARKANGDCSLCNRSPEKEVEQSTGQVTESRANSPFSKLEDLKKKLDKKH